MEQIWAGNTLSVKQMAPNMWQHFFILCGTNFNQDPSFSFKTANIFRATRLPSQLQIKEVKFYETKQYMLYIAKHTFLWDSKQFLRTWPPIHDTVLGPNTGPTPSCGLAVRTHLTFWSQAFQILTTLCLSSHSSVLPENCWDRTLE